MQPKCPEQRATMVGDEIYYTCLHMGIQCFVEDTEETCDIYDAWLDEEYGEWQRIKDKEEQG